MLFGNNKASSVPSLYQRIVYVAFITLFSLLATYNATSQANEPINFLKKGLEQKKKGNYKKALNIWFQAKKTLKEPDFQIAQAYIELVSDLKLKKFYQQASDLYFWGLSGSVTNYEQKALLQEVKLLKPLIGFSKFKNYKTKIQNKNLDVLQEIEHFWDNLDPTPLNAYNERLLEHWERISSARNKFSLPNSKEIDDRGNIYIKFGEPFYIKDGQLLYQQGLVQRLLREGIDTPSFGSLADRDIATAQRYNLETRVRQLHSYPLYEVWIYRNLTDDHQNTIFMFGTRGNTNSFEKIQSIEDLIPSEAYRTHGQHNYSISSSGGSGSSGGDTNTQFESSRQSRSSAGQVTISPALILQLIYYQQLSALDKYFGESFDEMMDQYIDRSNSPNSNFKNLAREFATIYGSKLVQIQNAAPQEKSTDKSDIPSITASNYSYRFLDKNNEPYLKAYSVIDVEDSYYYDLLSETNSLKNKTNYKYALISGYLLMDENNKKVITSMKRKTVTSPEEELVSIFEIPYQSNSESATLSHELHRVSQVSDSIISKNTTYSQSIKGLHNNKIELPKPLNKDELTLSDIIVSYSYSSENNFTTAHNKNIPKGSNINLYYELYNLQPDKKGISNYTFHYSIRKISKVLGIFKRYSDNIEITTNNSVAGQSIRNNLSIETSMRPKGEYSLSIKIKDLNSGSRLTKTIAFTIN